MNKKSTFSFVITIFLYNTLIIFIRITYYTATTLQSFFFKAVMRQASVFYGFQPFSKYTQRFFFIHMKHSKKHASKILRTCCHHHSVLSFSSTFLISWSSFTLLYFFSFYVSQLCDVWILLCLLVGVLWWWWYIIMTFRTFSQNVGK